MASADKPSLPGWVKTVQPYIVGGAAGMVATCVIQPIDMIKVRIQLAGETAGASRNPFVVGKDIVAKNGFSGLYKGLDSALLRQATYTTTRMGIFRALSINRQQARKARGEKGVLPFWEKALVGCTAGGIGALVGTPADVALVRMQADGTLPVDKRRNYTGVVNALTRMAKEEGALSYFRGCTPTVVRAMALNAGMLASSDQAKEFLEAKFGKGYLALIGSSCFAGFVAAACSLPFDFVKTRMQKMIKGPDGQFPYKGPIDCALKVLKSEGPGAFYSGFPTYVIRIAPHAAITLMVVGAVEDYIKANYK